MAGLHVSFPSLFAEAQNWSLELIASKAQVNTTITNIQRHFIVFSKLPSHPNSPDSFRYRLKYTQPGVSTAGKNPKADYSKKKNNGVTLTYNEICWISKIQKLRVDKIQIRRNLFISNMLRKKDGIYISFFFGRNIFFQGPQDMGFKRGGKGSM